MNITPEQKKRLVELFKKEKPEYNESKLVEQLTVEVNHWLRKDAKKRLDANRMKKALKKIDAALSELATFEDKKKSLRPLVTTPEGLHLVNSLLIARDAAAATPLHKNHEINRAYYHWDGEEYNVHESSTIRKNTDEAALIWVLRSFWISSFNESPTKHREHPFYEMAAIVLDKSDANTVWATWNRKGGGNKIYTI